MSITVTNQQNQVAQSEGYSSESTSRNPKTQLDQQDFLELLTVQLQNQDPMSPMSDMDFIASMSSFSSVEAMSSLSTNFETFMNDQLDISSTLMETMVGMSDSMGDSEATQARLVAQAYLGKEVTIFDEEKGEFSGVVDRVELIDKVNNDGIEEKVVGLVVNDEIFPVDQVIAVANEGGILTSVAQAASNLL